MRESRLWAALPAGLLVGVVLDFVSVWLGIVGQWFAPEHYERWYALGSAGTIAGACLAATGSLELGRRLGAQRARWAQLAASGFGVVAVLGMAAMVMHYTASTDDLVRWFDQEPYVTFTAHLLVAIGLAGAAGLWRRMPVLAAAITAIAALEAPLPQLQAILSDALPGRRILVYVAIASAAWMALTLLVTGRATAEAAEAPEQNSNAVTGLRRAGVALWVRLGAASLLMSTMSIHVPAVQRFTLLVSAASGAIAMMMFAWALVRVASASGTALPRIPLQLAAFLALWSAIVQSARALFMYQGPAQLSNGSLLGMFRSEGPGWTLATPAMAAIGIAVLLWSIARMARASGDDKLHRTAMTTTKAYVVVMAISVLLLALGGGAHEGQPAFLAIVFGTTVSIVALVLAASLCGKAATALEARAPLATATLQR